jgi:cytochrome c
MWHFRREALVRYQEITPMKPIIPTGAIIALCLLAGCGGESEPPADPATLALGERLAEGCGACHSIDSLDNRVGPHLVDIIGRPAASLPDYDYSPALRASGIIWDEFVLAAFIANPQSVVPGTKMVGNSLSPQEAEAIVTYLETLE